MRDTERELRLAVIRDTITDIRCARRDGMLDYAEKCERDLMALLPNRNRNAGLDRYGWPLELKAVQS